MNLTALGPCEVVGHKVAEEFVRSGASKMYIIKILLAPRAGRRGIASSPQFRRRPARALRPRNLPEWNEGKAARRSPS